MTVQDVINELQRYPLDMDVKLFINHEKGSIHDFDADRLMLTSETAYVNSEAPQDEWDAEDGKIELGDGKRYLLINPIIM